MLTNLRKIAEIFDLGKGVLQSSKNIPGEFDFITAGAEWKTHFEHSHDCEALVFAMGASGSLGRTHYVKGKFIASDLCFVIKPKKDFKDQIDMEFYHIYFNLIRDKIVRETATGTSKLAINTRKFSSYEIHFPDISYQKAVKNRFNSINHAVDDLKEVLSQTSEYVINLRQSLIQEAITGKLVDHVPCSETAKELLEGIREEKKRLEREKRIPRQQELPSVSEDEKPFEIPESWEWARLKDICFNHGRKTPDRKFVYIDVGAINKEKGLISDKFQVLKPEEAPSRARKIVKKGTVIYSTVRPYLLNIAIVDRDFEFELIVSTAFAVMHPCSGIEERYLFYFLRSRSFVEYVEAQMVGVAYPAINDEKLFRGVIPIPPQDEQKRIVERLDRLMIFCDQLETNIAQAKDESEMLMLAVLQEAFRGG